MEKIEERIWWNYLKSDLRELLSESLILYERASDWEEKFHDYSFIVFPAAKAYEGFLKQLFLDLGFISEREFLGNRFRIGKALNPSLEQKFREKESVYDRIVEFCGGVVLADKLWTTWKECRNLVFHWFPNRTNIISLEESGEKVYLILNTMDEAFGQCKINK
jgi:hypothetical protein